MTVDELPGYLKEQWPTHREQLLSGIYTPQPVRRVEIPKGGGGVRKLGLPTVLDRFIQQAEMQILQGRWDRTFSEHSFGFRPGRSAHQAVARARTRFAELRKRDVSKHLAAKTAGSAHGPWNLSRSPALSIALPNAYFDSLGLPALAARRIA